MLTEIDYAKRALDAHLNLYFVAEGTREGEIRKQCAVPANPACNCYSVAKLFTVTAVGLLFDRGLLTPESRVFDVIPELFPAEHDPRWERVTLDHIMRHRIGLEKDCIDIDNLSGETYPTQTDYLSLLLSSRLSDEPGSVYKYNDAGYYLLSRVIERVSGVDLAALLRPILMETMGFREMAWSACPKGYAIGATGLYLYTEDMLKLGILYLNKGVYGGTRILSEAWCDKVLERGYELSPKGGGWYGKGGMRGQMLAIHPTLGRAVAWHAYDSVPFQVMICEEQGETK